MEFDFQLVCLAVLFVTLGCGSSANKGSHDMAQPSTPLGVGHVAFRLMDDNHVHRAAAGTPPVVEDVSVELEAASSGADSGLSLSHDGKLAAVITTRFGCANFECLALVPIGDALMPSAATVPKAAGQQLHPADRPALANGGAFIVYSSGDGPHMRDLFIVRKTASGDYSQPLLLTGASTFDFNLLPSLTRDETSLVYDCSATGSKVQASLCRVGLDGSGWALTLAGSGGPGATAMNEVHSADFAPDGTTLVFEADWSAAGNQRIWKRTANGTLSQFNPMFTNDVTPCVLPDGRIVSLWLNRPGNMGGVHELKVMSADGAAFSMLLENADVTDIGISCSD
jgi:hypothetical protein